MGLHAIVDFVFKLGCMVGVVGLAALCNLLRKEKATGKLNDHPELLEVWPVLTFSIQL